MPEQYSFGTVEGNGIIVSTIKKCDDDDAIVLRCYDIEGKDTNFKFSFFEKFRTIEHTNIIEEEPDVIKTSGHDFTYKIGHHAIETFKIHQ